MKTLDREDLDLPSSEGCQRLHVGQLLADRSLGRVADEPVPGPQGHHGRCVSPHIGDNGHNMPPTFSGKILANGGPRIRGGKAIHSSNRTHGSNPIPPLLPRWVGTLGRGGLRPAPVILRNPGDEQGPSNQRHED